jgi:hypothetical protein
MTLAGAHYDCLRHVTYGHINFRYIKSRFCVRQAELQCERRGNFLKLLSVSVLQQSSWGLRNDEIIGLVATQRSQDEKLLSITWPPQVLHFAEQVLWTYAPHSTYTLRNIIKGLCFWHQYFTDSRILLKGTDSQFWVLSLSLSLSIYIYIYIYKYICTHTHTHKKIMG